MSAQSTDAEPPVSQVTIDDIRSAAERIRGHVVPTPLLNSPVLDEAAGCTVFVKAETLQTTGAFKLRGALNKLLTMDPDVRSRGVIAFSAGNHALGVAAAARLMGCPSIAILPVTAVPSKIESCRWWASDIVFYDSATEDREVVGRRVAEERGMTVIQPFDDDAVIAGQGTVGLEICTQMATRGRIPDAVLVCCSGGGLSSGIAEAVRNAYPDVELVVAEPRGYEKMARSLITGTPERNPAVPASIMDAIIGPRAGARPLSILLRHGARGLSVTDEEALDAMAVAFRTLKLVLEPGGAAGLAALLANKALFRGKTVVVVASGGNVDPGLFARALNQAALPPRRPARIASAGGAGGVQGPNFESQEEPDMAIQRIDVSPRLSKAVIAHGFVMVSGLTALEKGGGIISETTDVLAQIERYLHEAGTDRSRLVKVNIWLADMADFEAMDAVWQRWIAPHEPPARATVQAGLRLSARIEIMAQALA